MSFSRVLNEVGRQFVSSPYLALRGRAALLVALERLD